jgi:arabinofuranosyltransferase
MSKRREFEWIVLIVSTAIAAFVWQYRLRFPFDDTFISFRYAEHLAAGHGLVWNISGAHTEGYTNFLFVVLLAACRLVTSDLLVSAQVIGLACTGVTAIALQRLTSNIRMDKAGLVVAMLYLIAPLTWINALSGMETSLFVMLIALALLAYSDGSLFPAYGLVTLATLTRPEGALLGALFFFVGFFQSRRLAVLPFAATFVLPLAIYAVWKYAYFGYLLPNSFYIKVSESTRVLPGLQYVRLFVTSTLALIVATFGIRSRRTHPVLVVATLWSFTLIVFYLFVTPLEGLYDRFLWPALATLCFTAAIGLHDISERLRIRALPWGIVLLSLAIMVRSPRTTQSLSAHEEIWDASMERIASSLRALPQSSSLTIAYGDAGYVVYKSRLKHLDLFGLNDTRIAHARTPYERAAIVRNEHPDLLLLPIIDSSNCTTFVEDAYGVASDSNYKPIASCKVFPYRLALLLNQNSPLASKIVSAVATQLSSGSTIWTMPPTLCSHSTR